jgi:hypothetical protein
LGKCYDKNPTGTDCHALYGNFSNAAMTDNSLVTDDLYTPFFNIANFSTPESSILFWSGNMVRKCERKDRGYRDAHRNIK